MKSCYLLLIFIINGQILCSEFTAATNESNIFKTIYSTYALGFGGNVLEVIESNQSDHNWIGFSMRNDFNSSTRSMMINFPIIFVNKIFIKTDLIYSAIYDIPNTEKMMVNALNDEYPDYSRISYFNYKDYGLIIGLSRVQKNILKTELLVKPFMTFAGQYRSHGLLFELNYQRQINQNALALISFKNIPFGIRFWNTSHKEKFFPEIQSEAVYNSKHFHIKAGTSFSSNSYNPLNMFNNTMFTEISTYIGIEYKMNELLSVRIARSGMFIASGGLTINMFGIKIDYGLGLRDMNGMIIMTQGFDLNFDLNNKNDLKKVFKP